MDFCASRRRRTAVAPHKYVDYESGWNGAEKRKQSAALFDDAAKRKFDCVLFWALDRFSREGMTQTIIHLQRLSSNGVAFHSYNGPHLATDNELVRNILLALLSSLAKVEAQKIKALEFSVDVSELNNQPGHEDHRDCYAFLSVRAT
jgi:DNA invertase Pin-like site-specific DNA recombinase